MKTELVIHEYSKRPSGNCPLCGTWRRSLHRDHIIPRCKGGPDTPDNVQFICANCHEDKTREDMKGFRIITRGNGMRGRKHSEETKAKISAAKRGVTTDAMRGKVFSLERRAKLSAARRRRVITDETRAKISAALIGNHCRRKGLEARIQSLMDAAPSANTCEAAASVDHN